MSVTKMNSTKSSARIVVAGIGHPPWLTGPQYAHLDIGCQVVHTRGMTNTPNTPIVPIHKLAEVTSLDNIRRNRESREAKANAATISAENRNLSLEWSKS